MLLGIYWKESKTYVHKNMNMDVHGSFIHNCPNLEATKVSFNQWIDKEIVIYPDNGILSIKKKWAIKPWKDMEESGCC